MSTARRAFDGLLRRRARILAYHSVSPSRTDPWAVTPEQLRRHLQVLRGMRIEVVPLDELTGRLAAGGPLGNRAAVTFDDAYADFIEHGLPALRDEGVAATLFVPVGHVGGISTWSRAAPNEAVMSREQLEFAIASGVSIGSHSLRHRHLPDLTAAELIEEVRASRRWLRDSLGVEVAGFAYPFGAFGERERASVRAAGYRYAVGFGGLFGNGAETDHFALNRDPILRSTTDRALRARLLGWADIADAGRTELRRRS